jgi:hypothetical protein
LVFCRGTAYVREIAVTRPYVVSVTHGLGISGARMKDDERMGMVTPADWAFGGIF